MFRLLIFFVLGTYISFTDTLPVYTWKLVLEQELDGCPCTVQIGLLTTHTSRIASEIVPREDYNKWVQDGRPIRVTKYISTASPATFGNVSNTLEPKPFCFSVEQPLPGDYNVVIYATGDDVRNVDVLDITRHDCPNKSINDYGDSDAIDECNNHKGSKSPKSWTPAFRVVQDKVVPEKEIAAYIVKIVRFSDLSHIEAETCTGSLIAPQYVLTAAHCKVKPGQFVYIGEYLDMPGEKHLVTKTIAHPGYKVLKARRNSSQATQLHDIQLLRFDAPVKNAKLRMVHVNADCSRPLSCRHGLASGYGESATRACKTYVLRSIAVDIFGRDECHTLLKDVHESSAERCLDVSPQICATGQFCGSRLCYGASGGPLVISEKGTKELVQIGISSFFVGNCGSKHRRDIYRRLSAYKTWIYHYTNGTARFNPPLGSSQREDCSVSNDFKASAKIGSTIRFQDCPDCHEMERGLFR